MADGTLLAPLEQLLEHEASAILGEDMVRALCTFVHEWCTPGDRLIFYLPYEGPVGLRRGFAAWHARRGAGTSAVGPELPSYNSGAGKAVKRLVAVALKTPLVPKWQHRFHGTQYGVLRGWKLVSAPESFFYQALHSKDKGESFSPLLSLCVAPLA